MKNTLFICIALAAISPSVGRCEDLPHQSMKDGFRFYENKSYDRAADAFGRAAQSAPGEKLDASVAQYNAANARFRMGQFGAAATNFAEAMRSPNLPLQSRAYYNRGNALARGAERDEKEGRLDAAVRSMDEALAMYESTMTLSPGDEDAKVNYELALKKKQDLEQKQQQQQQQEQQNKQDQQQQKDQSQEQKDQQKEQQQKQDQQKNEQPQDQSKDQQKQDRQASQQQSADQQQKEQPAQPQKSEEMTPEEAKIMLDAMKQEEQASRDRMRLPIGQPTPVDKDW